MFRMYIQECNTCDILDNSKEIRRKLEIGVMLYGKCMLLHTVTIN